MSFFTNCNVVLDLKDLSFKEKKKVRLAITDNGGNLFYVVNKKCSFIVVSNLGNLSNNRRQSALKHQVPVVGLEFVQACLEKKTLLPASEHVLVTATPPPRPAPTIQSGRQLSTKGSDPPRRAREENLDKNNTTYVYNHQIYSERDRDLPTFPSHFQVAKYSIHNTVVGGCWSVLELQSAVQEEDRVFRIVRCMKKRALERDQLVFCSCSEDALEVFQQLQDRLGSDNFQMHQSLPPHHEDMASPSLKQLLLEEKLNCSTLSQEVGVFVELVWTEALGSLTKVLRVPALSISPNDVSRAEGLLLQVRRSEEESERKTLLEELHSVLPHTLPDSLPPAKLTSQLLDLCQVLRDTLCVHEAVMRSSSPSSLGKYRALGCSIERLPPQSPDYHTATQLLRNDKYRNIQIHQVFHTKRGAELQMFREELGNIKLLLHSTSPTSFVGILSRGLLLPRVGVEHHGVQRTDVGFLGGGIYFSDSFSTSVKYSRPGVTDGSRLLLVCEVALGHCREFRKKDTTLTRAPEGYDSVHGVRSTPRQHSEFEDDEYVVFSPEQVRLKYVVQYSLPDEQLKDFQPHVDTSVENIPLAGTSDTLSSEDSGEFEDVKNPLDSVTAGLLDSAGQTLPLQAVHVKCKLVDLLSQVIIFQKYSNPSTAPIEAKYVFPLEESAAVCGFEAFINGKHVIGQVKEKEQARREYKQAIEKGHGAYLMDQEAPDVFTISVGNLPPGATVLIKVTFISELLVKGDSIFFQLPGSVAPWQQNAALNARTQATVEKVCVSEPNGEFSLSLSIEMPYEITRLCCVTHRTQTKRTNCKAVVSTLPGETLGSDGFQLYIRLSEMHMPRMWVENHPDKDSQACMLVFYPDFSTLQEASEEPSPASGGVQEVLLLLDSSESMRGESLLNARHIALHLLSKLDKKLKINIMLFGTDYKDAFVFSKVLGNAYKPAKKFIETSPPVGGSTELWRPLRSLSLLPPSLGTRSLVLLSDGHMQNPALTLQLVRSNAAHTRLFTCGLSKTANKHMLRIMAQAGGGAYEFFDTKTRHTWSDKVASQVKRLTSPGCSSVAVKWQLFNPTAPPPVQAPAQLNALFNNCHTLVYGFVPHCTQASLYWDLCGKEIKTMVSTTELQKTKGTFLHKLTARSVIRDYEDGILHMDEAEHEGKKAQMKSFIIELSKEFSILSQFTSFVAIEERDGQKPNEGFTDIPKLIAEEDVDLLPYVEYEYSGSEEDYVEEAEDCFAYEVMDLSEFDEICFDDAVYGELKTRDLKNTDGKFETQRLRGMSQELGSPDSGPVVDSNKLMGNTSLEGPYQQSASVLPSSPLPLDLSAASVFSSDSSSAFLLPKHSFSESSKLFDVLSPINLAASRSFPLPPPHDGGEAFYGSAIHALPICESAPPPPGSAPSLPIFKRSQLRRKFICTTPVPAPAPPCSASDDFTFGAPVWGDVTDAALLPKVLSGPSPVSSTAAPFSPPISLDNSHSITDAGGFSFGSVQRNFTPFCGSLTPTIKNCSLRVASVPSPLPAPPLGSSLSFGSAAAAAPAALLVGRRPQEQKGFRVDTSAPSPPPLRQLLRSARRRAFYPAESDSGRALAASDVLSVPSPVPPPHLGSAAAALTRRMVRQGERVKDRQYSGVTGACHGVVEVDCGLPAPPPPPANASVHARLQAQRKLRKKMAVTSPCEPKPSVSWELLACLQNPEGYWECTEEVGKLLHVDLSFFANVFLKERGISSLGPKAHADILRLVSTLLVLQLVRVRKLVQGELLQSLFRLRDPPQHSSSEWEALKRAVDWVCWADRQYPCVCSRLEFGRDWESSTRQLLGFDSPHPLSPLKPLLERNRSILAC